MKLDTKICYIHKLQLQDAHAKTHRYTRAHTHAYIHTASKSYTSFNWRDAHAKTHRYTRAHTFTERENNLYYTSIIKHNEPS